MSYGYSARVVRLNKQASKSKLGVVLGRLCIALDIPASEVANIFGVSKQTIYNWFVGIHDPKDKAEAVTAYIKKHS
jgi:hypothetical protein